VDDKDVIWRSGAIQEDRDIDLSLTAGTITGGTGKFVGMQGIVRSSTTADPKAGVNEGQSEIEY